MWYIGGKVKTRKMINVVEDLPCWIARRQGMDAQRFAIGLAVCKKLQVERAQPFLSILAYENWITTLPRSLGCDFTHLRLLDLHLNSLRALPDDFGQGLGQLIQLDLSRNQLRTLPRSLGQCTRLAVLNCSYNALAHLPPTLSELKRLQTYNLHDNKPLGGFGVLYINDNDIRRVLHSIGENFSYHEARVSTICLLVLARLRKTHALSCINNVLEYVLAPMLYETREDDDAWRRPQGITK